MSRNVITIEQVMRQHPSIFNMGPLTSPPAVSLVADDYLTRLIKYVPPEIIAGYSAIVGIIQNSGGGLTIKFYTSCGAFAFLLACTPLYLKRIAKISQPRLIVLNTLAFAVWAFALPSIPFNHIPGHDLFAPIVTVLYTVAAPLIEIPMPHAASPDTTTP